jgi:selenobiotic family peptide radical SAM maturase
MALTGAVTWKTDLERLEQAREHVRQAVIPMADPARLCINPSLELISLNWHGLVPLVGSSPRLHDTLPVPGEELVLLWRSPTGSGIRTETAQPADLLALKIVVEGLDPCRVAREADVTTGNIDAVLQQAIGRGILLAPASRIRRPATFRNEAANANESLTARIFTLQWHITQKCDLACHHCYDRSPRRSTTLEEGLVILDQLGEFCRDRFVSGQVSFSGGNPFLHPDFTALYRAAAERGVAIAILGNPVPREMLEEVLAIQFPVYLQVSMEGLEEHNDLIRGAGHFQRTLEFLDLLAELAVPSEVMLTLTRDNLKQVLPLAEILRDRTGAFTFNRLVPFGAGANLTLPSKKDYAAFLRDYLKATARNPVLALKDSLINIVLEQHGQELFGGCAGFGCGAAFNFLALLPDGEVHACRKFPSVVGNIHSSSLAAIYDSPAARRYRMGSSACSGCRLKPVCGGCPAFTAGAGLDPATARDPYCFRHGHSSSHKQ